MTLRTLMRLWMMTLRFSFCCLLFNVYVMAIIAIVFRTRLRLSERRMFAIIFQRRLIFNHCNSNYDYIQVENLDAGFREELNEDEIIGDNTLADLVWNEEEVFFSFLIDFDPICSGSVVMEG